MTSTVSSRRARARQTLFITPNYLSFTQAGSTPRLIIGHRSSLTRGRKKAGVVRRRPSCRLLIQNCQQQCGKVVEAAERTLCNSPEALWRVLIKVSFFFGVAPSCLYSATNCCL